MKKDVKIIEYCLSEKNTDSCDFRRGKIIHHRPAWIKLINRHNISFLKIDYQNKHSWYKEIFANYFVPINACREEYVCFYNHIAGQYNTDCEYMDKVYDTMLCEIQKTGNILDRILDIMGGSGGLAYKLLNSGYKNITLLDNSPKMLQLAKKKCKNKVQFLCEDILYYEKQSTFDIITCSLGLHHFNLNEIIDILKKVRNVLSEYGIFLNIENNNNIPYSLVFRYVKEKIITIPSRKYGNIPFYITICKHNN